jgi:hypothetical protein
VELGHRRTGGFRLGEVADIRILAGQKWDQRHQAWPLAFVNQGPELAAVGGDGRRQTKGEGVLAQLFEDGDLMLNILRIGMIAVYTQDKRQRIARSSI